LTLVTLDTNVLQAIVQAQAGSIEQADRDAFEWMQQASAKQVKLALSTIVVGEFLAAYEDYLHADILGRFTANFMVVPFDLQAAQRFAVLRNKQTNDKAYVAAQQTGSKKSKQEMRVDSLIIAHAMAMQADALISLDQDMVTLALGMIAVQPPIPDQRPLF
jgi:predicted nucleic acid-binding protein